jgi:histone acetyltransferase (RNA polymerase elongator complex component)
MKSIKSEIIEEVEKISIGTRKYYEKRGFEKGKLYMHKVI